MSNASLFFYLISFHYVILVSEVSISMLFNSILATIATFAYALTLYPGINRDLKLRRSVRFLAEFRKQIGIASCLLGLGHVGYIFLFTDHIQSNIMTGVICTSVFILLTVTSNRWSQKRLGKFWKHIHSLTYGLPFLLIWHIMSKMEAWSIFTRFNIFLMLSLASILVLRFMLKLLGGSRYSRLNPILSILWKKI